MTPKLPAGSRKCRETRPTRAALLKRPSGRSRLLRNDPSTISSPATPAADPDKPGRPRSDRQPHNHSPPALTSPPVQISGTWERRCVRRLRLAVRSPQPHHDKLIAAVAALAGAAAYVLARRSSVSLAINIRTVIYARRSLGSRHAGAARRGRVRRGRPAG